MLHSMTTLIPQYFPSKGSNNAHFKTIQLQDSMLHSMPNDFFRLLIVGPSGSGKTNLLMHLLFKPLIYYDKIVLYAKNLEQHYYREMIRRFEKIAEKLGVELQDLLQASIYHISNIIIIKKKIADYVDPPRVVPLIGPAQLHHAHYKCTIYFTERKIVGWPVPHTLIDEDAVEVIYIDHNHFHMVGNVDLRHSTHY